MSEAGCKRGPWSPPGEASGCGPLEWSILRREEGRSGRGGPLPTPALLISAFLIFPADDYNNLPTGIHAMAAKMAFLNGKSNFITSLLKIFR